MHYSILIYNVFIIILKLIVSYLTEMRILKKKLGDFIIIIFSLNVKYN